MGGELLTNTSTNRLLFFYGPFLPLLSVLRIALDVLLLKTNRISPLLTLLSSALLFFLGWVAVAFFWFDCTIMPDFDTCYERVLLLRVNSGGEYGQPLRVNDSVNSAMLGFGMITLIG